MKYINQLEIINKGFEAENKELKEEINDLKIYLAMAQGARDLNERMLFAEQKEKKEIESKLTKAEKQIKLLQKTINTLSKENEKLKNNNLNLNTQAINTDLQEMLVSGLNFLTKAMTLNQNNIQKI